LATPDKSTITFEPKSAHELSVFFKTYEDKYHEFWIILTKKRCVNPQPVSFIQAVDEAVKQGLIDSRTKTLDEQKYAVRFTKRKNPSNQADWKKEKKL
jgi:hypothetical protein